MRFIAIVSFLLATLIAPVWSTNNGLQDVVEWDKYSLIVDKERTFILSAELHYSRLPVPELWLDILEKLKAEGFNTISIYVFWGFHSPAKDEFDFEHAAKNIQKLFDYAKQVGLWVIVRAGPYCNAETNAGGLALYLSDGSGGKLRTGDETYHQAWLPWIENIGPIIAANQVTKGGPVILNQHENELQETVYSHDNTLVIYMKQIDKAFKDAGVVIPSTHNEKGQRAVSWSTDYNNVGGAVNIYGLDTYPGGLSCTNPDTGFNIVRNYYQWFSNYSYTQPEYFPEFEGGWFQPWGGSNYDDCATELSPEFPDVYYKNNIGQRTTLLGLYMTFGGTNWGHSAAPVVYSSYDYSAPLRETREVRDKLKQIKLIGLFTRVSDGLRHTDMESNGTGHAVSSTQIFTWVLKNPDTGSRFYTLQHNNSKSRESTTFDVYAKTSLGPVTIPDVNLNGRQSKIVPTDYKFGKHTLLYSSGEVLTYAALDRDVIALYLDIGQTGVFAFAGSKNATFKTYGASSEFKASAINGMTSYSYVQGSGATIVEFSSGALFYLFDRKTAWNFHAPPTVEGPAVKPNKHMFVLGPHIVRSGRLSGTSVLVTGDIVNATEIEVYAGSSRADSISFNSQKLSTTRTAYGSLKASIPRPSLQLTLPALTGWKTADSLPESSLEYDDGSWTVCNKTTTKSPYAPITLPVLFSSDYGYYVGAKAYRARFPTLSASAINITAAGGLSAGWSAWLNGKFFVSSPGTAGVSIHWKEVQLPKELLRNSTGNTTSSENLLTVLVGYTGHDQTSTAQGVQNPRGLLGASIAGSNFTSWKIRGAVPLQLDPVRNPMNEGGLYGERLGWHLPGFSTKTWKSGSPSEGATGAGVRWYSTTAKLNIPDRWDVPLGLQLSSPAGTIARIGIWVNGYLMGKYVPHIGPQTKFPVPPGIWNTDGTNYISLAVWAMDEAGAKVDVKIIEYARYQSGFELGFRGDQGLRPDWEPGREKYA